MRPNVIRDLSARGSVTGIDGLGDGNAGLSVRGFPLDRIKGRETAGALTVWRKFAPGLRVRCEELALVRNNRARAL
jgi:hypothetical protein